LETRLGGAGKVLEVDLPIAEVGATAATFPTDKNLVSWVGAFPGDEECAWVSRSHRSPKGNRNMRRLLSQCASAAVKLKGSIFQLLSKRGTSHVAATVNSTQLL
jgi:hypothetical protein